MLCPVFACGVRMSVAGPSPTPRPLPAPPVLRLELHSRRSWPSALASLFAHAALIAGVLVQARAAPRRVAAAVVGGGQGPGTGGGAGAGIGPGVGGAAGPGTGDEGGYIFVAAPRTAILPPLAKVPGSVAGRTYRVRFWVAADGRVTRVEVEPPIAEAAYSREFQQRMMAFRFYPAHTRDGQNVASVVTVPLRIGN